MEPKNGTLEPKNGTIFRSNYRPIIGRFLADTDTDIIGLSAQKYRPIIGIV